MAATGWSATVLAEEGPEVGYRDREKESARETVAEMALGVLVVAEGKEEEEWAMIEEWVFFEAGWDAE